MKVIKAVAEMSAEAERLRREGKRISFVPTMGNLHEGHLSLMRMAKPMADVLVISIFVNPLQFEPGSDFNAYPRTFQEDLEKCEPVGVDIVFAPLESDLYPEEFQTTVEVKEISKGLCGDFRPGHFKGVATVVLKLFNIVKPNVAVFGEKDYQQLCVIRRMVRDLNLDIQIVGHPTVREADGLAMSSRNQYLSPDERKRATLLCKFLKEAKNLFDHGERRAQRLIATVQNGLAKDPRISVEYVSIRDRDTLKPLDTLDRPAVMALAVHIGETRLIDNIFLGKTQE
jgi:pantoate--beta-alanine ligase